MFLDLSLFGLGGRHLLVGGGVFRKGVWRLLICLAVSFGVGGGRGVEGRANDLSAMNYRLLIAAYLACFIFRSSYVYA
jgi:hypothetical protein